MSTVIYVVLPEVKVMLELGTGSSNYDIDNQGMEMLEEFMDKYYYDEDMSVDLNKPVYGLSLEEISTLTTLCKMSSELQNSSNMFVFLKKWFPSMYLISDCENKFEQLEKKGYKVIEKVK